MRSPFAQWKTLGRTLARTLAVEEIATPIGRVRIYVSPRGLTGIDLPGKAAVDPRVLASPEERELPVTGKDVRTAFVARQLREFFAGKRKRFEIPLAPEGGPFDQKVWARVAKIPYATVATYGDVARDIGHRTAFRAVGASNGRNRIPIVIPCHRVVGAGCRLTGFGGGIALKAKMLALEGLELSEGEASAESRVLASGS